MCAHLIHWLEEKNLVVEEMHRVIEYFHWKVEWWQDTKTQKHFESPIVTCGAAAYTSKQAAIYAELVKHFGWQWYPVLMAEHIDVEWTGKPS